ncbi:uncharacterized protein [Venturia canescens]|uniref:uncharacterized protein n=1 Tax=Venturia canescens TaxID=32260 RepID=UPI001C9BCD35|nr:uncharacterized protein LOC122419323 [Venturia canescens]
MREKNVTQQSDRSYLCLVAIYAIHAVLLNVVFLQPNFDNVQSTLTIPPGYGTDSGNPGLVINMRKNLSETVIMKIEQYKYLRSDVIVSLVRSNTTGYVGRRKIDPVENGDDDYTMKLPGNTISQSKSSGSALHFTVTSKTSSILRLLNRVMSDGKSLIERLSPAALGIIAGCLVFLLTFTENECA